MDFTGTNSEKIDKLVSASIELRTTMRLCMAITGVSFPLLAGLVAFLVVQSFTVSARVDRLTEQSALTAGRVERQGEQLTATAAKVERLSEQSATTAGKVERLSEQVAAFQADLVRVAERQERAERSARP